MATLVLQPHQAETWLARRPWLSLYGVRLKGKEQAPEKEIELALIQRVLPQELLLYVFSKLPAASLAAAQGVCRQWQQVGAAPSLWRTACSLAFHDSDAETDSKLVRLRYRGCWKTMLLERPHVRFDGIYVSRNTYLKQGVVEWRTKHAVHLVLYFRYLRFFPDGTFLYRTTPLPVKEVAKTLQALPPRTAARRVAGGDGGGEHVHEGRFRLKGDKLLTAMRYQGSFTTEIRSRLRLRSTTRGANNRLDIESIVSWDITDQTAVNMMAEPEAELDGEGHTHRRGTVPYVFVPFHAVATSVLNLPVDKMDVWLPG